MKKVTKYLCMGIVVMFFLTANSTILARTFMGVREDYDPLVDVEVTVEIQKIRAFDKFDRQVWKNEYIDADSDPDMYVKVLINGEEFISDTWDETKYIYDPQFAPTFNVDDEEEFVDIQIHL